MRETHPSSPTKSDESDLQRVRSDLLDARESCRQADQAKSDFIANMSHELRTPMNAVIGMAEALWETDLSDEQRKMLSVLLKGGRTLLSIINDVLDLSRLQDGKAQLTKSTFVLGDAVKHIEQMLSTSALRKGLRLEIVQSETLTEATVGDRNKIEQVLLNLVGNAIKFTPSGTVKIRASRLEGLRQSSVLFEVEDTGIGIPAEALDTLFDRFTQADLSVTKTFGGSGLGLAISKQLVEMMSGEISVESQEHRGSTFRFTTELPLAKSVALETPRELATPPTALDLSNMKILVAEDSLDNAFIIKTFLAGTKVKLDFAANGREAIEKFESSDYDLILMDVQMPEMDGYSATKWIRLLESRRSKRTPIIALTAYAFEEQIKKSFEAGCDAHLSKPITKKSLFEAIAKQTGGNADDSR